MINIMRQRELFIRIGKVLPQKMELYAIGGTAMMLQALKEETKDVDFVFTQEKERKLFYDVAKSLGYEEEDVHIVYGNRPHAPMMVNVEDARIDLFTRNVLGVQFSDEMMQRAEQIHEFINLIVRPANIHDIIIMKSNTDREKDEDDILVLLKNEKLNWQTLIDEASNQVALGNERAILGLGHRLEKISNKGILFIPKEVLDKLWSLLQKQVKQKKRNR